RSQGGWRAAHAASVRPATRVRSVSRPPGAPGSETPSRVWRESTTALPIHYRAFAARADRVGRQPSRPTEVHMSDIAQPHVPVRLRVRSNRLIVMVGAFLVIAAAIVVVALSSGSSESTTTGVSPVSPTGGPHESPRCPAA